MEPRETHYWFVVEGSTKDSDEETTRRGEEELSPALFVCATLQGPAAQYLSPLECYGNAIARPDCSQTESSLCSALSRTRRNDTTVDKVELRDGSHGYNPKHV